MNKTISALVIFLLTILFSFSTLTAAENLKVDAKILSDRVRLTFANKDATKFTVSLNGNMVTVKFDRPFSPNFSTMLAKSKEYILSASIKGDAKTIQIVLKQGHYRVNKFVSENFVGVDIINLVPSYSNLVQATPQVTPQTTPVKSQPVLVTEQKKPILKQDNKLVSNKKTLEVKTEKKESKNLKDTKVIKQTEVKKNAETPQKNIVNDSALPTVDTSSEVEFQVQVTNNPSDQNIVSKKWKFPWQKDVAAAVFERHGYLWIVFNSKEQVNLDKLKSSYDGVLEEAQQIDNNMYTILRFKFNKLHNVSVYKEDFNWIIEEFQDNRKPQLDTAISQYKSKYTKGIFFAAQNMDQKVLTLLDPEIGDLINIVTFYQGNVGISQERHFIDFDVLKSYQGFVVTPLSDNVRVTVITPGIEIIVPLEDVSKVVIGHDVTNYKANKVKSSPYSLLPFEKWHSLPSTEYNATKLSLQNNVLHAPQQDRNPNRVELAKFYLGVGFAQESLSILNYIDKISPDFFQDDELKFLKGVALFLSSRYDDAKLVIDNINTKYMPEEQKNEVGFWQQATNVAAGLVADQYDFLKYKDSFINTYPPQVVCQLAFLDVKANIMQKNFDKAEKLISTIDKVQFDSNDEYLVNSCRNTNSFYKGLYLSAKGDSKGALDIWQNLVTQQNDKLNTARAEFNITKTQFEQGKISVEDAIKQVNKIKGLWRGDDLEAEMLNFLAELYYKDKNYTDALRTWKQLTNSFPKTNNIFFVNSKMGQLFIDIFKKDGLASQMPPFKAVSLFYEFHELLPVGKVGDDIVEQFAYELVKLDLLGKASALLDHAVDNLLSGSERIRVGTKLALIYLLDKKPGRSLEILDKTNASDLSEDLKKERTYIRAKAYIDSDKYNNALNLIKSDNNEDARNLRAHIYWLQKDCSSITRELTPIYQNQYKGTELLSTEDAENLLYLALCNVQKGEQNVLNDLYNNFATRLPKDGHLETSLKFLVEYNGPLDTRNLEESLGLNGMESFLEKYKQLILVPSK